MKTREEIITGMCYTFRHDYGLEIKEEERVEPFTNGMTKEEKEQLYKTMAQIFDNDIKPYMVFREWDEYSGMPAVKDYSLPHNVPVH